MKTDLRQGKSKGRVEYKLNSLKGKKILITGGLGFIGSNLAHKCLRLGAKITIFDNLNLNSGGNIYNIHDIKNSIKIVKGNILNYQEIIANISDKDIIFNCAASSSHPFSMRKPLLDLDVNNRGVINLLEAVRRFNPEIRFIQLGTTTQLGKLLYKPADELHPEFTTDIYSANKSAAEKYVLIYGKTYSIPVVVIRLPNVFGPRACINNSEVTFVNYFIGLVLQKKDITIFGDGKQLRNLIYVDDCIKALIMAAQNKKVNDEVLFATGDEHYSVAKIAQMISKYVGSCKVKFIRWPRGRKAIEVGDAVISNEKIKRILGWYPQVSLEEGLIKTRKYYQKCLKYYFK